MSEVRLTAQEISAALAATFYHQLGEGEFAVNTHFVVDEKGALVGAILTRAPYNPDRPEGLDILNLAKKRHDRT